MTCLLGTQCELDGEWLDILCMLHSSVRVLCEPPLPPLTEAQMESVEPELVARYRELRPKTELANVVETEARHYLPTWSDTGSVAVLRSSLT